MMCSLRSARVVPVLLVTAAAILACVLGGCASPPGVEVTNSSGRTLKVEYLGVRSDGTTELFSSGAFADGSTVTYKVEQSGTYGARVRFSLPEAPEDESSLVQLKLSDSKTRYYDLVYLSGRLLAREMQKGRLASGAEKTGDQRSRSTRDRRD